MPRGEVLGRYVGENRLDGRCRLRGVDLEAHEPHVDQVETHDQKAVNRIDQQLVAQKGVHQKDPAAFEQRLRYPNGNPNANQQVKGVSPNGNSHDPLSFPNPFDSFVFVVI